MSPRNDNNVGSKRALTRKIRIVFAKHIVILSLLVPVLTLLLTLQSTFKVGDWSSGTIDAYIIPLPSDLYGLVIIIAFGIASLLAPQFLYLSEQSYSIHVIGMGYMLLCWSLPMLSVIVMTQEQVFVTSFFTMQLTTTILCPMLLGLSAARILKPQITATPKL